MNIFGKSVIRKNPSREMFSDTDICASARAFKFVNNFGAVGHWFAIIRRFSVKYNPEFHKREGALDDVTMRLKNCLDRSSPRNGRRTAIFLSEGRRMNIAFKSFHQYSGFNVK